MAMRNASYASSASTTTPRDTLLDDSDAAASGSDTSISSPDAYTKFLHSSHTSARLAPEAIEFLADLSNYLALGCLVQPQQEHNTSVERSGVWQDVTHTPPVFPENPTLSSDLSRLATAGWVRVQAARSASHPDSTIYRLYVLPGDVGLRFVDRSNRKLIAALESLVAKIDSSADTWSGRLPVGCKLAFDPWATAANGSLFYMFNSLPSPAPNPRSIDELYAKQALEDLLKPDALPGLKSSLYPYQRRSAGLMLQRESVANLVLDPRLEPRTAPDGSTYYFAPRDVLFYRNPRYYEACRGGILAETMGLGKTLMCLALVLATRRHLPKVPAAYEVPPVRSRVGSLTDMVVSAIKARSIPWEVEFEREQHHNHEDLSNCRKRLEADPPRYEIPIEPSRWNRKTITPPPKRFTLAATTIIVVPRNLCSQWHSEIRKHVEEDFLRILVMEDLREALPPPAELRTYDIVLFSRNRFELEQRDGSDDQGRRIAPMAPTCRCPYIGASRIRDCHCVKSDDLYDSPLKHLHFKRLIIDEGHFFSANNTAALVANTLVTADHRWVVSGTPAKSLMGVEVDISASGNLWHTPETNDLRDAVLKSRRDFNVKTDTAGAVKSLGSFATNFLKIKPWSAQDLGEKPAVWDECIFRHEGLRKTYSGFSKCLPRTLEAMVVKTQPEDVDRDIDLPPLYHDVVVLEPSYYDKLTANLFSLVLTANAVTSERTDADYLFHPNSKEARYQLIKNLRQSAFFWTGFSEDDVNASKKTSNGYLEKEGTGASDADRKALIEALQTADAILASSGWKALSQSHELGLFVDQWPEENREFWAFGGQQAPLLTGISQVIEAQKHVHERIGSADPGEGMSGVGIRALARARDGRLLDEGKESKPVLTKSGIPTSSLNGEPALKKRSLLSGRGPRSSQTGIKRSFKTGKAGKQDSPVKSPKMPVKSEEGPSPSAAAQTISSPLDGVHSAGPQKRSWDTMQQVELPESSPYAQSRIVGTTSAKLSYLVTQILKHYQNEKILVFYDGDNAAYYIAQMLDVLNIKHEIYAKSLAAAMKSEYVVRFNQKEEDRVLLMDVGQAAYGLNICSASRVYFVNPVLRPNIEAQAIKRAHRIGQEKPVYVETLLLRGTIEEKMHERAKRMDHLEHSGVSHVEDDGGMRAIIQSAKIIPVSLEEEDGAGQMAPLEEPQRVWGRLGWREALENSAKQTSGKRRCKTTPAAKPTVKYVRERTLTAVELPRTSVPTMTSLTADTMDYGASSEDEPMMIRWRRQSESHANSARSVAPLFHPEGNTQMDIAGMISNGQAVAGAKLAPVRKLSIADLLNQ